MLLKISKQKTLTQKLIKPHPTQEEMKIIYESALRAPDHARYMIIPKIILRLIQKFKSK